MSSPTTIADGKVVSIHYSLTLDDGSEVDSSRDREPMNYLHGSQNIVPGLEKELTGKELGDKVEVVVPPEEGYGPRYADAQQHIGKKDLPPDMEIQPGMQLGAEGPDGVPMVLHVVSVDDDGITVDLNHPLAGQNLHFTVDVIAIRDATEEEKEHGHPH